MMTENREVLVFLDKELFCDSEKCWDYSMVKHVKMTFCSYLFLEDKILTEN